MDGIKQRNNVLVIALTNRRDLIDPALLRPGRLEVQLEVPPPTRGGREQILQILFRPWVEKELIQEEASVEWAGRVAAMTDDGWTGADLAGLVRCAVSFLTERYFESVGLSSSSSSSSLSSLIPASASAASSDNEIDNVNNNGPMTQEIENTSVLGNVRFEWHDIERAYKEVSAGRRVSLRTRLANYFRSATGFLSSRIRQKKKERLL